ncbi:ADP-ribose pyrophosphatase YjhB (NUDIX family) [Mycolicibacterium mucogenicum 261Sha1.1M5]|nr:ADP-ribose pyrophosphatase YjhB (NUDIX family) [Mycolicibacterium mucogenicum 261Sha1.1M5]
MDLRVAAYAVIERRGKILLTHWRRGHLHGWTLPGGGIEPGEDPKDAVVREVFEETGLQAKPGRLLGVDSRVMVREEVPEGTDPEMHTIRIVYRATVQDGPLRNEVDGSSDEARWVALKDVNSLKTLSLVQTGLRMAGLSRRGSGQGRGGQNRGGAGKSGGGKSGSAKQGAQKHAGAKSGAAKAAGAPAAGTTKASAARPSAGRSRSRGR